MLLTRVKLIQVVLRLQLTKQQFYLPPTSIDRCQIRWQKLFSRQIRYIQMVVVGVLVADADDAEPLAVPWLRARVLASIKCHFRLRH